MRIEDYAFISDLQSGALVGRNGSIDWGCFPRFDSEACFAALVGKPSNGRWLLAPKGEYRSVGRRYRPGSLILETELRSNDGEVQIIDFMPIRGTAPDIVRIVRCLRGRVVMKMEICPRFDYGRTVPYEMKQGEDALFFAGPDCLYLRSSLAARSDSGTPAEWVMEAGDEQSFVLTWFPSHLARPNVLDARQTLDDTQQWWSEWSSRSRYEGAYQDAVGRSLCVLKGLTHAPTGGIVAAPTTSLPEKIGGHRNWDYRCCWIRDATFTLLALLHAGYDEEARAWRDWLVRAVGGDAHQLQVLYGVEGERQIYEHELPWLSGYLDSRPVRAGNAAVQQMQLDIFGEMFDTLHQAHLHGLMPTPGIWTLQRGIIDFVAQHWEQPDQGIWEVRGEPQLFTHSKVMAWVAMARAVESAEKLGLHGPLDQWHALRDRIREEILRRGYNTRRHSFVQTFGGEDVDASLLLLPVMGFLPATDERMRGTVAAIEHDLLDHGFVRRYRENDRIEGIHDGHEGAFLACTFWLADNYVLQGRVNEARALFERLIALRNDVGLLSEEYDVEEGLLLGNFPQAFSHVALINTAHNLQSTRGPAHVRGGAATSQ